MYQHPPTHQVKVSRKGVLCAPDSCKFFETPCIFFKAIVLNFNYTMRFIGYDSLIHNLSLSKSHNNVASLQKNRGDK